MSLDSSTMTVEKPVNKQKTDHKYRVFQLIDKDRDMWKDLGLFTVQGPADARKQAVAKHELGQGVRDGRVTLVAIADRFWIEKTPKAEPQPDRITWD